MCMSEQAIGNGDTRYHHTTIVATMDAIALLRAVYLSAAAAVLLVFALPPLRSRFLDYGARRSHEREPKDKDGLDEQRKSNAPATLLDYAAALNVPHSWFTSFYAVSVVCSLYWLTEVALHRPVFQLVAEFVSPQRSTMAFSQVQIAWALMLTQGSRRLYESLTLSKSSQSRMWFGHWALGVLFYVCTSVAVWIEGISAIKNHVFTSKDLVISGPSLRTFASTMIFILASGFQHDCHSYLAALKTSAKGEKAEPGSQYRLPDHPAWNLCLTPHYFAECLVYLSLAIVATPRGAIINWTLVCALLFVIINLGVTAHGTKKWYEYRFGKQAVNRTARMIPFVY